MNFKQDTKAAGYNQEEIYFYWKDRDLIEKNKQKDSPVLPAGKRPVHEADTKIGEAQVIEFRPRRDINRKKAA